MVILMVVVVTVIHILVLVMAIHMADMVTRTMADMVTRMEVADEFFTAKYYYYFLFLRQKL